MAMPILVCLGTTAVLELRRMAMRGDEGRALDELRTSEQKLTKIVQVRERQGKVFPTSVPPRKVAGLTTEGGSARGRRRISMGLTPTKKKCRSLTAVGERNSNGRERDRDRAVGSALFLAALPLAASNTSRVAESVSRISCQRGDKGEKRRKRGEIARKREREMNSREDSIGASFFLFSTTTLSLSPLFINPLLFDVVCF